MSRSSSTRSQATIPARRQLPSKPPIAGLTSTSADLGTLRIRMDFRGSRATTSGRALRKATLVLFALGTQLPSAKIFSRSPRSASNARKVNSSYSEAATRITWSPVQQHLSGLVWSSIFTSGLPPDRVLGRYGTSRSRGLAWTPENLVSRSHCST